MGWLPQVAGTGSDYHWAVRVGAWVGFAALLVVVGTLIRMVIHDRFIISDVSAGGATVKLTERTPTYFDEYLDDIVNYFDSEEVDIVVLEDLDRFNDPHIYEALRELNTLLNNTNKRTEKSKPLRFVYAVRDSLFEKLGDDTEADGDDTDAAIAETLRANRTKFFDAVIPMVPFISHRNARELLTGLLRDASITGIDRQLVNLVAQHSTDMRLLRNMCNEYLVFTERLLESKKVAPGLTASNLFALVAYKNFHLKDFEQISRRGSDLDRLYDFRRDLVRNSIAALEQRKRDLASGTAQLRTRASLAHELAQRLRTFAILVKDKTGHTGWPRLDYEVSDQKFTSDEVSDYQFWKAAARADSVTVLVSSNNDRSGQQLTLLSRMDLMALAPEGLESDRWSDADETATRNELASIDRDIAFLRGADFDTLAAKTKYTLMIHQPAAVSSPPANAATNNAAAPTIPPARAVEVNRTFAELVKDTMKSDLAFDMVKRGYVNRNFTLYAAQFYGDFTGVDVATFMVQNVQTNIMEIDYEFTSPGAITNLLDEADNDFTCTVAAYNIDVLNYLLETNDRRATNIVDHIIADLGDDENTFLAAYFTSGAQREKLAACLADRSWFDVFTHIIGDDGVPADVRPALVNAALCSVDLNHAYDLPPDVNEFIIEHYSDMPAFTQPQDETATEKLAAILDRAGILIPDLSALNDALRELVVSSNRYQITAPNLRAALGSSETSDISFDRVREHEVIYNYCLAHPRSYLAAIDEDSVTPYTICSPGTLTAVLSDVVATWTESQLADLVNQAAPSSCLEHLHGVPKSAWPHLASANLFRASLSTVDCYEREIGSVDIHLATLLEHASTIHASSDNDVMDEHKNDLHKEVIAIIVLNAHTIKDPATRVRLVRGLELHEPLRITEILTEPSDLFAQLLEHGLVADDASSFAHFRAAGWAAIGPAVAISKGITSFITPGLVNGMVADILNDPTTRDKVGRRIVANVEEFVSEDDPVALNAVAQYANNHRISLTPETVVRVAQAGASKQLLTLRLLHTALPAASAQHVVDVFAAIGQPYNNVERTGTDFSVEYDGLHKALLTTLQNNGVCTFNKKRGQDLYVVNVT